MLSTPKSKKNSTILFFIRYQARKNELLKQIDERKTYYEETLDKKVRVGKRLVEMQASLQNIESLCKMVIATDGIPTKHSDFDVLKDNCEYLKVVIYI